MKKALAGVLAAMTLAVTAVVPAMAEDWKEMGTNAALFPVKVLAIGSGLVVGTPIAILRRTSTRCVGLTQDMAEKVGGKDSAPSVFLAGILGVPCGLIVGSGEGVYYGGRNAIKYGYEKPFRLENFSAQSNIEE